ncbi:hypothetical protein Godav_000088 [Gossypium davidsonii]|uniref:DUF7745 domain-containing protein n=1 Tax=Gossypium davidsonii TaxID=34287 RepID=A0A7J8TC24_GOSDV|nr:hypothetical protein [Gossypium davidsonii]
MEKGFLDRVEDNAVVRTWVEMTQYGKGDSLAEGYVSELWDFTRISVTQNNLQEQASVSSSYPVLEPGLQLLHIWECRFAAYNIRIHGFTSMFEDSSGQGLLESCKRTDLFEEDIILAHPDVRKKVDVFALSIYGLVVFPKALGHFDEAITDLFDRLKKKVTPVPVDKVSYRVFSKSYSPLKEIVATPRRDDISEEKWMAIFQNLQEEDIEWRAPWLLSDEILYRCGDFDWVPLLRIWGAVGCATLLVLRQYSSMQFVPVTQGLAECEFSYRGDGYRKRVHEMVSAWSHTRRMKRLAVGLMTTPEYSEWWVKRINDNVSGPKAQARNEVLEKSLSESQKEKGELKDRVVELEGSLCQHRSQNSVVELKASLSKIEKMKGKIEGLEAALRNCEVRIEHLEAKEGRQNEQLHYFQNQVKDRDHVIGEVMV